MNNSIKTEKDLFGAWDLVDAIVEDHFGKEPLVDTLNAIISGDYFTGDMLFWGVKKRRQAVESYVIGAGLSYMLVELA